MIGIGSLSRLNIGIAVSLRDNFTNRARTIRNELGLLYGDADRVMRNNKAALSTLANGAMLMGVGMSYFTFSAVKKLANFEKSASSMKAAIGTDMDLAFDKLEKRIKDVAVAGRYSLEEIANAGTQIAKAGFKASDVYNMIGAASDLGTAGDIPIVTAADALGRVLNTYDMAAGSADRVADKISIAANKSSASVESLLESLKYSGDVLKMTNVPFEDALAIFARLGSAGLRGSIAGTSVANMLRYLNKATTDMATGKQDKALDKLGLGRSDLLDDNGNLKQLIGKGGQKGLLDILGEKLAKVSPNEAAGISEALMGVRGNRGFIPLMEITQNVRSLKDLHQIISEGPPGSAKMFSEQLMDNLWGDLEKLRESWTLLMVDFASNKGVRGLVQVITQLVQGLTSILNSPVGRVFGTIVFYGGPILLLMGGMVRGMIAFSNFTMKSQQGMLGLLQTTRAMNAQSRASWAMMGMSSNPAAALHAQNLRVNSRNRLYMGAGGGMFNGTQHAGGRLVPSAGINPAHILGLQAMQNQTAATTSTTRGLTGMIGRMGGGLGMLTGAFSLVLAAMGPVNDMMSGNMGGGIGGILGGLLGFAMGGPMGAVMGSMMGQGVGGMFDRRGDDESATYNMPTPAQKAFSVDPQGRMYASRSGGNIQQQGSGSSVQNNINVNIDGVNAYQNNYENANNESVYTTLGY